MARNIREVFKGSPVMEGAGVRLRRVFGFDRPERFDPFLLLDDFRSDEPEDYLNGFPWHPHRGIETITYVLKGDVEHGDSMGNSGVISSGDVQWMTAGSGIVHQEMPRGDGQGSMHGFQLWANLPARDKMMAPRYRSITSQEIPTADLGDGIRAKVIAGNVAGVEGPVRDVVTAPQYLDVSVPDGGLFSFATDPGHTVFLYMIGGTAFCDGRELSNRTLALFGPGESLEVAGRDVARFLLMTGRPLGEPIAWRGPIVMNTRAELDQAFRDYREGTFIKEGNTHGV